MEWILISSMTLQNDIEKITVHWKPQYWHLKPFLSKLKVICMIAQSTQIVKRFKESCQVGLCIYSSAEFALPFLQHCSTGPDLRAARQWPNSLQQMNLEYEMHFEVNLLQLPHAGIVGYQGPSEKNGSAEDLCECWLLKKPVWDCSEKERKVGPTCNVRENANEKNAVAASRAGSLALPALVMDIKTGSESISSNEKQYTSFPMQWTYKFNSERSQVLLL